MSLPVICDGCGKHLDRDGVRMQLEQWDQVDATQPRDIFSWRKASERWDFCGAGCVATWAVARELEPRG